VIICAAEPAVVSGTDIVHSLIFVRDQFAENLRKVSHPEFTGLIAYFESFHGGTVLDEPELCIMIVTLDRKEDTVEGHLVIMSIEVPSLHRKTSS
jgi:hypothetical protein